MALNPRFSHKKKEISFETESVVYVRKEFFSDAYEHHHTNGWWGQKGS